MSLAVCIMNKWKKIKLHLRKAKMIFWMFQNLIKIKKLMNKVYLKVKIKLKIFKNICKTKTFSKIKILQKFFLKMTQNQKISFFKICKMWPSTRKSNFLSMKLVNEFPKAKFSSNNRKLNRKIYLEKIIKIRGKKK